MHAIQALVVLDEKDIAAAAVMTGDSADEERSVQFILRQIRGTDRQRCNLHLHPQCSAVRRFVPHL